MSCFPFFKQIDEMRALVVGGGEVALRRAKVLADFGAQVTCVAPEFCEGFSSLKVECIRRGVELTDVAGVQIVVAATDDHGLNASIAAMAKKQGCEVCAADDADAGTFLFPGIIRRGELTVGLVSGGVSPAAVKYVRERIEDAIPDCFEDVLDSMQTARKLVRWMIPEQRERSEILRRIFEFCLNADSQPQEDQMESMIRQIRSMDLD